MASLKKNKMELVFELSGKEPNLAKGEINALFEAFNLSYKLRPSPTNLLIVGTPQIELNKIREIFNRLGFVHGVYKKEIISNDINEIIEHSKSIKSKKTYCVRAKRIKNSLNQYRLMELEKKIGQKIKGKVDLDKPKEFFKLFLSDKSFILTKKLFEINRSKYRERKPHKRNYFKPGAIEPELARAVINLTRTKNGPLLDIFSGTGSFLIESMDMGIESIGIDIDRDKLIGSRKNFPNQEEAPEVIQGDARNLPIKKKVFDAVVIDPPYGRSSKIVGNLKKLYKKTLKEALSTLRDGGYICFISPKEEISNEMNINEIESYKIKEHRSLTRNIKLFRRR